MTQSIIVYRNPMEAAFWEGASNASFFPIVVGVVAFFIVFLLIQYLIVDRFYRWNRNSLPTNLNLFVSAVVGALVVYKMWI